MTEFYKISCIDKSKECNIIEPISEKLKFTGVINPISGALFSNDDIQSAMKVFDSKCLNKNGEKGVCCDPQESKFKMTPEITDKYKNNKFRINREFGKIKSIDKCEDLSKCNGPEWQTANPFLLCKIGENTANVKDNVLRFETLNPTCYQQQCNNNDISFGDLISGTSKNNKSRVYVDLKLNESIKEDNTTAINTFLNSYKLKTNKLDVDYILTDTDNGDTLLLRAIKLKANKIVNLLLSRGANLNIRSVDKGMYPLHYAAEYADDMILSTLVNYGARTDVFDFKGWPPLFYAIKYGNLGSVIYLTNQNPAMLQVRDKKGNTALHITYMHSKYPDEIARFLIENGIDVEIKNNNKLLPRDIINRRTKLIKEKELNINTERFLEPFQTLGTAEEVDETHGHEMIKKLKNAESHLSKAHVNKNSAIYKGFVSAQQNLQGPIEFNKYACYPYADLESKKECIDKGGHWMPFEDEDMKTTVKVDYSYDNETDYIDENAEYNEIDVAEEDDNDTQNKKKKRKPSDDIYYPIKRELVPLKTLPFPVDHDSLMGIKPSPSPSSSPSPSPSSSPSPSPSSSPSSSPSPSPNDENTTTKKDKKNTNIWWIIFGVSITVLILICIVLFLYLRK
jgi:ankyrin repeat protein